MIQRRLFHVQKKVRLRFSLFFLVFSFSVESSKKMVFCVVGNPYVHLVRLYIGDLLLKCLLGLVSISQNRWPSNKTQILVLFQDLQACLSCEQKLQCCCCAYKMCRPCTMHILYPRPKIVAWACLECSKQIPDQKTTSSAAIQIP